jgi:hypothetical protein
VSCSGREDFHGPVSRRPIWNQILSGAVVASLLQHRPKVKYSTKARNASPIPIQTCQRPRAPKDSVPSTAHLCESAPPTATQSAPSARDILRNRMTTPILQPTAPTRPPALPREPHPSPRIILTDAPLPLSARMARAACDVRVRRQCMGGVLVVCCEPGATCQARRCAV